MKYALLAAINNYPNKEDRLRGCLNDQANMLGLLGNRGYYITTLFDKEVTCEAFKECLEGIIKLLVPGDTFVIQYSGHGTQINDRHGDEQDGLDEALYLYDGVFTDDIFNRILSTLPENINCLVLLDSCFSGTATRNIKTRKKYITLGNILSSTRNIRRFLKSKEEDMKWVVISGCSEDQTSADAFISGKYNGAFTYYLVKAYKDDITIGEWFERLKRYLPSRLYPQIPTIEGMHRLFEVVV